MTRINRRRVRVPPSSRRSSVTRLWDAFLRSTTSWRSALSLASFSILVPYPASIVNSAADGLIGPLTIRVDSVHSGDSALSQCLRRRGDDLLPRWRVNRKPPVRPEPQEDERVRRKPDPSRLDHMQPPSSGLDELGPSPLRGDLR